MEVRKELYIGGRWTAPRSSGDIAVVDSRTEEPMGSVPRGAAAEVEKAVTAARTAFPAWAASSVADRVATLRAIADGLSAREEQLADLMSREVGTPIATSRRVQVGLSVDVFRSIADILEEFPLEERIGTSLLIRQPAGVVAAIDKSSASTISPGPSSWSGELRRRECSSSNAVCKPSARSGATAASRRASLDV